MSHLYIEGKLRQKIVTLIKKNKIPDITKGFLLLEVATSADSELIALLLAHFNDKKSWLNTYLGRSVFFKDKYVSLLELHIGSNQRARNFRGGAIMSQHYHHHRVGYGNKYNPEYDIDAVYKEKSARKLVNWKKRLLMRALSQAVKHANCSVAEKILDFGVPIEQLFYQDEITIVIEERRNNDSINGYGDSGNIDVYADLFYPPTENPEKEMPDSGIKDMLELLISKGYNPWQSQAVNVQSACEDHPDVIKITAEAMMTHEPDSSRTRSFLYQHYKTGVIGLDAFQSDHLFTKHSLCKLLSGDIAVLNKGCED